MAEYRVEHRDKKAGKAGNWWVVIGPDEQIVNDFWHTHPRGAHRQCELINIFENAWREKRKNQKLLDLSKSEQL